MTQFSFEFKIIFTFIYLSWFNLLVSSAASAESVPFPKEPIATSINRMDDKLNSVSGGGASGAGGSGSGNGDRFGDRDSYVLAFINFTYSASDGEEIRRSEEKARYGEGRILNVQGHLVHVTREHNTSDHTACTENIRGTNNKPLPPRGEPWIALVRRGSCTFEKKIRHVWLQGAAGVIVYNDEASVSLEKMKIIEKDRNITAVFTFRWIGEEMARVADSNQKVWVSISEGSRGYRANNINKTSVLFVSISFIILMVISLVWLIFYYIQRFRYLQSKDQNERNLCSAAKRIIMKIPTKSGKTEDKEAETDCCAICIENYKSTDCIRVLPCRHEFHKNCIDPWLLEHRTCPMCKLDILKHYGFVVGDPILLSLTPESPSGPPLVSLNAIQSATTTSSTANRINSSINNITSVAVVTNTRPNFDPSQLEEIIEPSSLITIQNSNSNTLNNTNNAILLNNSTANSSSSVTTTALQSSNNALLSSSITNNQNNDLSRNLVLLKQNSSDVILNGNKNSNANNNNSYCNISNNSNNIISNSNNSSNCNLNKNYHNNCQLQHSHNNHQQQHQQQQQQQYYHQNNHHNHYHHPHQHQHSHSLSSIIVTNDDLSQNFNNNSNNCNSNYQLPRISTSANHILQNFGTNTTTSSHQIIGSQESFLDLDLDAEIGRSRLSRRRNSDISVSTTLSNRAQSPMILNRASLTINGCDDTQLLHVPSPHRIRSSSLQLLSPFTKRIDINNKTIPSTNNASLSPDDIRNFDMDLNNIRTKPVYHKRLRSRSADTSKEFYNNRSSANLDYYKFKNEASTSGTRKSKQFLENIQISTPSSGSRRQSNDESMSKAITTPCNITIRIISDDDNVSETNDKNNVLNNNNNTSHL